MGPVHYSFKMNSTSVAGGARTHHQIEMVIFVCFYTIVQRSWLNEWVWYFLNLRPNKALKTWYAKITPLLCSDKCVFVVIFTCRFFAIRKCKPDDSFSFSLCLEWLKHMRLISVQCLLGQNKHGFHLPSRPIAKNTL